MSHENRAVTDANLGAWIVQGNPQRVWNYFTARAEDDLGPGDSYTNGWTLHPSYRVDLMEEGQLIVLWLTGVRKGSYWPGVYEIGVLDGPAEPNFGMEPTHKVDPAVPDRDGYAINFFSHILHESLRTIDLKQDLALAQCEKFRVPMLGNPLFLTPRETVALASHLPAKALEEGGWNLALQQPFYTEATE